ncbi:hypothetical protein BDP55DRAFT_704504 [Colletotrichum godetiae]|uniref:Uncharacterized protein n=1 Tax=Colletotrichum godetiae TaxID=1209918 RepID=A0AAJ0AJ48_9PEZI|nr:uncharacterized protein BDP55DRAFT_704504 [Colletotrichum godetiae]KAK1674854.1 hypothetical protein BDP55DRAFT_704504 [Colletotrichum godetiae]
MGELEIGALNHFVQHDGINHSDINTSIHGWVAAGRDSGSVDILWSSLLTIILCVWAATHSNALLSKDKGYHGVLDKINPAMIALLGPDFLFGLAIGQLSSARRSVKMDSLLCGGQKWTYNQAFFVDMGFPVDAEQLHYLVKHGFADFPDMDSVNIAERNTIDTLSTGLPTTWHRAPLDDITPRIFRIAAYWCFYKRLGDMLYFHPYGRPNKQELWDRFPSDLWRLMELMYYPLRGVFIVGFSNFQSPTPTEQLICVYLYKDQKWHRAQKRLHGALQSIYHVVEADSKAQNQSQETKTLPTRTKGVVHRLMASARSQVNNSAAKGPTIWMSLFVILPNVLISGLYVSCRMYFYVEDFVSLREQPKGIYLTGNRFLPFIGETW